MSLDYKIYTKNIYLTITITITTQLVQNISKDFTE